MATTLRSDAMNGMMIRHEWYVLRTLQLSDLPTHVPSTATRHRSDRAHPLGLPLPLKIIVWIVQAFKHSGEWPLLAVHSPRFAFRCRLYRLRGRVTGSFCRTDVLPNSIRCVLLKACWKLGLRRRRQVVSSKQSETCFIFVRDKDKSAIRDLVENLLETCRELFITWQNGRRWRRRKCGLLFNTVDMCFALRLCSVHGRSFSDRYSQSTTNPIHVIQTANTSLYCSSQCSTVWVKKGCHPIHGYNFVNSWSIWKILSLL